MENLRVQQRINELLNKYRTIGITIGQIKANLGDLRHVWDDAKIIRYVRENATPLKDYRGEVKKQNGAILYTPNWKIRHNQSAGRFMEKSLKDD